MEDAAESAAQTDYLCARHGKLGLTCTYCHSDESTLSAVHEYAIEGAAMPKRLRKTDVPETTCTVCHDKEQLKLATADVTVLTDMHETTVNPHDLTESFSHATVTCGKCHSMHSTKPVAELAPEVCLSCHHMNVYECHTCHG